MKSPLRMADITSMDRDLSYKTIGGEMVIFRKNRMYLGLLIFKNWNEHFDISAPTVNNVSILANFNLPNGNEVFLISEVLFMSEAVVSRLHQVREMFVTLRG